jgi:hypothetical protein
VEFSAATAGLTIAKTTKNKQILDSSFILTPLIVF